MSGVGLAATFTCSRVLTHAFQFWLDRLGINEPLQVAGYNQVLNELHAPQAFRGTRANVIVLHLPDLLRVSSEADVRDHSDTAGSVADENDEARGERDLAGRGRDLEEHACLLCDSILNSLRASPQRPLVLVVCPWPQRHQCTWKEELCASYARAAQHLASALADAAAPVHVVLPDEIEARLDGAEEFDPVTDRLGHVPMTNMAECAIATAAARRLNAELGSPPKVVAVDCDNTLWGNAVADVGPNGLCLESHHRALHERLRQLAASGVLVCLCSRNEPGLVMAALAHLNAQHGLGLELGRELLSSMLGVAATGPKADSLRRVAKHLNLSLSSFVLIDDNAAECLHVRIALPEVQVVLMPANTLAWMRTLNFGAWPLVVRCCRATAEDMLRTQMYEEQEQRQAAAAHACSLDDLLRTLRVEVEVGLMAGREADRLAQLTHRTNQFNALKVARTASDIVAFADAGGRVVRACLRDRFGDYGIVALAMLRPGRDCRKDGADGCGEGGQTVAVVEAFTMSCRALGRGVS